MGLFVCLAVLDCPAVAPGGRGSMGPGAFSFRVAGVFGLVSRIRWPEAGGRGGDACGPGPAFGDAEPQAAAAAGDAPGDGEQAQPQALDPTPENQDRVITNPRMDMRGRA